MPDQKQTSGDEGWISIILPLLVVMVVSIFTTVAFQKFTGPDDQPPQTASNVLVFSLSEWVSAVPPGQTEQQIDQHFENARKAAQKARELGYIVLHENSVIEAPDFAKLKPGMFYDQEEDGGK